MTRGLFKFAQKSLMLGMTCMVLSAATFTAKATGVPTVDVAAIAQAIQQVLMLQQQYDQLIRHLNQLERTHENFTGDRGFGGILSDIRQYDFVTRQVANDVDNIRNRGYAALSGEAQTIYNQSKAGVRCVSLTGARRTRCEREVALAAYRRATWRQSQRSSQEHMKNINQLRNLIASAKDAKGIAEVQARISHEQNALATQTARLDAIEREFEAERRMAELEHKSNMSESRRRNEKLMNYIYSN